MQLPQAGSAVACSDQATRHLQSLLLQAVCNGSITDAKRDIDALVRSTLLAQQSLHALVHCATMQALAYLRRALPAALVWPPCSQLWYSRAGRHPASRLGEGFHILSPNKPSPCPEAGQECCLCVRWSV